MQTMSFWYTLRLPAFLFSYPFSILLTARLYATICAIATLFIWQSFHGEFVSDKAVTFVAIADLLNLLLILISLWFIVQKFFYVKVDAALSAGSLFFILSGLVSACSVVREPKSNDLLYLIICHLYLVATQCFSLVWILIFTSNTVSHKFILNWGASTTSNEIELLESDF